MLFICHPGKANTPNILFIIADDMGVDAIKGFGIGERHPTTPNLDNLRSTGITFTNVWSTPVCSATRASLLTGKYGINNGVNSVPGELTTEHKSIFREIEEQSDGLYKNCLVGKWHLAKQNDYDHPFEHGIEEFMGLLNAGVTDYYNWTKYEDGSIQTCNTYATEYFTDYAIDWINQQQKPWLMWLAHVSPHTPLHVPPEGSYSINNTDNNKRKYKAMIESMDHEIGRLLDAIPEDVLENTIIIFLGDNGTPGNLISGFPNDRGKGSVYQGGINVPLIISGKGVERQNDSENALINVSDLYITIAQLVNPDSYPADSLHNSYSFKHLLDNSNGKNRLYNYMELGTTNNSQDTIYTIRDEQFKLIDLSNGNFKFYDLLADTFELNDLLGETLTIEQETAYNKLSKLLNNIRGEATSDDPASGNQLGKAGKYPVIHTAVNSFYDEDSEISDPGQSNILFWQDGGRINNEPSYTDNGDGTVTDKITGLVWQQDMGEKISYSDAVEKVKNLTLGGHDDWRIPTIKELYSLIDFTGRLMGQNADELFINSDYFDQPLGDVDAGEREIDAQTWSSTHYQGLTMIGDSTIFGVNFVDGRIKGYPKYKPQNGEANKMYFRMVRGNQDYGKNLFMVNQDGTITDSASMLMWQQTDDAITRDWLSSIQYCEDLELAGYDDWHLPNIKELQSIVDYSRSPTATDSPAIDEVFDVSEIDDPDGNPGHYPFYWSTTTHLDGPNPYSNAAYISFGEALGRMNGNLLDVHGAGAQRSDPKIGDPSDYPAYHGPQGDLQMVYNHCRCVRTIEDQSTGIILPPEEHVLFYPNPTENILTVDLSSLDQITGLLSIYNLNGQRILSESLSEIINEIDVSSLPEGMYILLLVTESGTRVVEKFVKQ